MLAWTFFDNFSAASGMGMELLWITLGFVAAAAGVLAWVPRQRKRAGVSILLFLLAGLLLVISAFLLTAGLSADSIGFKWMRFIGLMLLAIAVVNVSAVIIFDAVLIPLRLGPPDIVRDLVIAAAYLASFVSLLSNAGVNLTGIVATSAVMTAVIGFSLQDTLGNIMGGMAIQLDRSLSVGDWIRVGELEGRVVLIRWRHTAIETRNWDTVLIPNSQLVKSQVTVLGRRTGQPIQRRVWINFNVDFKHSPTAVIDVVETMLREQQFANVAAEPAPHCILTEFKESCAVYAVRYWLIDMNLIDLTSSIIRSRIYSALQRAGIKLAMPAQIITVTQDSMEKSELQQSEEMTRRLDAVARADLFSSLNEEERRELATRLRRETFVRGETIMRQGARGDWLYILVRGQVEVRVTLPEDPKSWRTVATLKPGELFGEMGLMTGGERAANVVALADATCYRVDKADFMTILTQRPAIAEEIARVLARRLAELQAVRENLTEDARQQRQRSQQIDLVQRIRRFFALH